MPKQRKVPSHNPSTQKLGPVFIHGIKYVPTVVRVKEWFEYGEPKLVEVHQEGKPLEGDDPLLVTYLPEHWSKGR